MRNKNYLYWQSSATRREVRDVWIGFIALTICMICILIVVLTQVVGKAIPVTSKINPLIAPEALANDPCGLIDVVCEGEPLNQDSVTSPKEAYHLGKETEIIIQYARQYNVDEKVALKIAFCESSYDSNASNPNSTAKGLYQFTDPTWKWIGAKGHQFDTEENIKQFIKWFPKYPMWWKECI